MGRVDYPETVMNYRFWLRNAPEERRSEDVLLSLLRRWITVLVPYKCTAYSR